jgi:hypothetical protein
MRKKHQHELKTLVICVFGIVRAFVCGGAPAEQSLADTSQTNRDTAAMAIRQNYVPPSKTNWSTLLIAIQPGMARTNVLQNLDKLGAKPGMCAGSGSRMTEYFHMDELWALECVFDRSLPGNGVVSRKLVERMQDIWVEPPIGFSGSWRTYYMNGQLSREIRYKDGLRNGESTSFNQDGSKSVVWHSVSNRAEGLEEGFYASGHIHYKGRYHEGKEVGLWLWFNEDGSVQSKQKYKTP